MFNIRVEDAERAGYIKNRHYKGGTSFPEQFIFRSLLQMFPRAENRMIDSDLELEFDIYVPELNLRIEYSGSYWHNTEAKQNRDQKRREYCKQNNATYVEVIEKCGKNKLILQKEGNHLVYTMSVSDSYSNKINRLIEIIEDLMYHFDIYDTRIDYTRAMYEAFMISTPYQYNIIKDDDSNIVGKKYTEQVYSNYYIKNSNSIKEFNKIHTGLVIRPIERDPDILIQDDYEILNQLMFSGKPIEGLKIKTQEEIELETREMKLSNLQKELEKEQEKFNKEKEKLANKVEQVEELYQQLKEKIKKYNREMFKINNERSRAEDEKRKFENNIKEEYSKKLDESIDKMEKKITKREKKAYEFEITQLKNKIEDDYTIIDELNEKIRNYKKVLCRYELDRQARGGMVYGKLS